MKRYNRLKNNMNEELKNIEENKKIKSNFMPASQGKRFLNSLLDGLFIYIIVLILDFLITTNIIEDENNIFILLLVVTFYLIFETIWAKTPAKFITATKVITEDGEQPVFSEVLTRTLIRFIPFESFSFLSSNRPRGWHDRWSKTMVVDDIPFVINESAEEK